MDCRKAFNFDAFIEDSFSKSVLKVESKVSNKSLNSFLTESFIIGLCGELELAQTQVSVCLVVLAAVLHGHLFCLGTC